MKIDFKKLIGMERCVVLQAIAEGYLLRTTGKHFSDEFPNVKEEYGVLVEEHLKLLKDYLSEQYTSRNLDLNECIEKSGEKVLDDKLTKYETESLIKDADLVLTTYAMVEERKRKLLKK
jgi:hypothetical protein